MIVFVELTLTLRQTFFVRNLNSVFVLCTVLDEGKISESLNLSFHRLVDLSVLSHIIRHFTYFWDLNNTSVTSVEQIRRVLDDN